VILTRICFWEKDKDRIYNLAEEVNNPYVRWVNFLDPVCQAIQWFLDRIHPRWTYVRIDPWDTWSMDHTLADIILPMLRQLNETKHGAPNVDDLDVPEDLRRPPTESESGEMDEFWFARWNWILDEMIWAFEQKVTDDADSQFFDHSECGDEKLPWNKDGQYVSKIKYDKEGHAAWQARKDNGFRLFGKYFEALWT
jgi:hypothetical protein